MAADLREESKIARCLHDPRRISDCRESVERSDDSERVERRRKGLPLSATLTLAASSQ
jgi:hypothetical protein